MSLLLILLILNSCGENKKSSTEYVKEFLYDRIVFEDSNEKLFNLESEDRIYYLVRHAEKDSIPKDDPTLTAEGEKRAAKLAELFRQTRVDVVYSTVYMRTLLTVDSLVKSKGMSIKAYNPGELEAFADTLKKQTNMKVALIVGHSNTTPTLAKILAGSIEDLKISESEYDHLFVVIARKNQEPELLKLKFRNEELE